MSNISITNAIPRGDLPSVIAQSAQRTGVDFQYLIAQAELESGMRPDAKAQTSSATGLYQFIEQTWLGLVKENGGKYGVGWAQDAISRNGNGKLNVADNAQKASILALRNNPELSANLAGEFARDNGAYLEQQTGRKPESVDLYLAHFLGAAGAAKFLNEMDGNPGAPAAASFPQAARANRNIFFNRAGEARSLEAIRGRFEQKLSDAVERIGIGNPLPTSGNVLPPSESTARTVQPADYLRIARAHAADQNEMNRSKPFSEPARAAYLMLATLGM
ncbi:transglycosylase SLT domain-containing protein [Parasphingorhabdus cellanae]|uniref:Transglycosylase SLT domain-containing protein n=1 Tax=Parasphingorhabdus cellanae TaxID=2806553 RepID=A0ABX7T3S1_9SPHN|nr:transglycosylase SLT domain-containing protein [Parasphingorhabdus cellanae]QTD55447.1 transglycosylase SLT domain-containing protein [Parasphingorhabdus cellanae]